MMVQIDDAWETMNELGKLERTHFIDLNKDKLLHELSFSKTIKRIEEIEKNIEYT